MGAYDSYKKDVLEASLWLLEHGYFGSERGSGGNVSARIMEHSAMAVTPSSVKYQDLSADDICVVGLDLCVIEGELNPSVESGMHSIIYNNRPDVNAIVHTHQVFGSVFAVIGKPVPALFDEVSFSLGPVVDIIPYALSGTAELADNVAGKLSNNANAYIIENHGILALGRTLERAVFHTELLEKAANIYCLALSTGRTIHTLPEWVVEMVTSLRDHEVNEAARRTQEKNKK